MNRMVNFLVLFFIFSICLSASPQSTLTVTSPTSEDIWYKGSTYTITWTKTGIQDSRVKLRLYDATGRVKVLDIEDDTENDGAYNWTIPFSVADGRYVIRVKTLDNAVFDDSDVFSIRSLAGIVIIKPQRNAVWEKGKQYLIQWQANLGQAANTSIDLVNLRGTVVGNITRLVLTRRWGRFDWRVPENIPSNSYKIRFSPGNEQQYSSEVFTIRDTTPDARIQILQPTADQAVYTGENFDIKWSINVLQGPEATQYARVRIQLFQGSSLVLNIARSIDQQVNGSTSTYRWRVPSNLAHRVCRIKISTLNGRIWAQSPSFRILYRRVYAPTPSTSIDFSPTDIYELNDALWLKLKYQGEQPYRGSLTVRLWSDHHPAENHPLEVFYAGSQTKVWRLDNSRSYYGGQGTTKIMVDVNPGHDPAESSYANNFLAKDVPLQESANLQLIRNQVRVGCTCPVNLSNGAMFIWYLPLTHNNRLEGNLTICLAFHMANNSSHPHTYRLKVGEQGAPFSVPMNARQVKEVKQEVVERINIGRHENVWSRSYLDYLLKLFVQEGETWRQFYTGTLRIHTPMVLITSPSQLRLRSGSSTTIGWKTYGMGGDCPTGQGDQGGFTRVAEIWIKRGSNNARIAKNIRMATNQGSFSWTVGRDCENRPINWLNSLPPGSGYKIYLKVTSRYTLTSASRGAVSLAFVFSSPEIGVVVE